ncbi:MAG: 16S rRNA (guanine(527)-N(7))-methyltransferase RsmG [Halioglobus sp.]|nr:16S rRNA (guanine(527)-N(7))-methyltransferase RsmG [Halioglobus sp.]|tara:strand:+ start:106 stop:765 length:660 start_codon:yes stop_codon:yes gene_type:complete
MSSVSSPEGRHARTLQRGCQDLGLDLAPAQRDALLHYLALLERWNRSYNLTAVRDPQEMVTRHLLDSLAVSPHLQGARILDVGSGAGLPGVPLAIMHPGREFHLLDSNGKRTRFLFQVKTALRLANMVVHQARVETFPADPPYDEVLSRAFASLGDMYRDCRHLLAPGGRCLAMKGTYPAGELNASALQAARVTVHPLQVPGLDEHRHLVDIRPQASRR